MKTMMAKLDQLKYEWASQNDKLCNKIEDTQNKMENM